MRLEVIENDSLPPNAKGRVKGAGDIFSLSIFTPLSRPLNSWEHLKVVTNHVFFNVVMRCGVLVMVYSVRGGHLISLHGGDWPES